MAKERQLVRGVCTVAGRPTVPVRFAGTIPQLLASLAGAGLVVLEPVAEINGNRATSLGMAADSAGTVDEDLYLLRRGQSTTGADYVEVQRVGTLAWTIGATAIAAGVLGPDALFEASGVAVTSTGVLEARTGTELAAITTSNVATVEVPDVGEVAGLLRVFNRGAGSKSYALGQAWGQVRC